MKTFLLLTVLALVAYSYAAPTSNLAAVEALLNNLNDVQLESLLNVQAQDDDDDDGDGIAALMAMMQDDNDDGIAEIKAMLQDARFQSWFKKAFSKVKDFGKKAYSGIKKVASNPIVGAIGKQLLSKYLPIPVDAQDDDDDGDGIAALMAMMQDDTDDGKDIDDDGIAELEAILQDAQFQSFWSTLKNIGKKVANGVKKVASNPIVGDIGKQLLSKYIPVDAQDEEEEEEEDDGGIAEIEAMLQDARFQSWFSNFGKKALSGIKKVASNPIVGDIGKQLLSKYIPVDAQDEEEEEEEDDGGIAEIEAMLQDARFQSWFRNFGKKALSGIKKVASNPMVGAIGKQLLSKYIPVDAQDDDDDGDGIAALMAMMQDNDDDGIAEIEAMLQDARFQSWFKKAFSKVKDFGKKAYSGIKKVASNPIVGAIGKQLLSKYLPIPVDAQDDDDDGGIAALMAMMQDNDDDGKDDDDDGIAEIEAMLQDARFQGWKKSLKSIGKKAYRGAKKVASNPTVRGIGNQVLSKYMPVDTQDDNTEIDSMLDALLLNA